MNEDSLKNNKVVLIDNVANSESDTRRYLIDGEIVSFNIKGRLNNRRGVFTTTSDHGEAEIYYSQLGTLFFDTDSRSTDKVIFGQVTLKDGSKHAIIPDKVNDFWRLVEGRQFQVMCDKDPYRFLIPNKKGSKYKQCRMALIDFILFVVNLIKLEDYMGLRGYCKTAKKYDFLEV